MKKFIHVGLGEIVVSKNYQDVLVIHGLGSCIALCIYDPLFKIGGMAHIMLPINKETTQNGGYPGKFANTAVPYLIEQMREKGAIKSFLQAKIFGGSVMFKSYNINDYLDIGRKNIIAVKDLLERERINIETEDVGGHLARTVQFYIENGKVICKKGLEEKEL